MFVPKVEIELNRDRLGPHLSVTDVSARSLLGPQRLAAATRHSLGGCQRSRALDFREILDLCDAIFSGAGIISPDGISPKIIQPEESSSRPKNE